MVLSIRQFLISMKATTFTRIFKLHSLGYNQTSNELLILVKRVYHRIINAAKKLLRTHSRPELKDLDLISGLI